METIRVNMTPCEDVQTIHASQNDGEAREWGFALHNNGDVIDSSEISDQLVFKAYKGGTEQILPENGSVPTTSPIIADIKYPQGLLTDQEFAYRQSPTEEDGLAKIQTIYGNTLKWNQLVQPISRTSTLNGITYVYTTDGTMEMSGTAGGTSVFYIDMPNIYPSKKVLIKLENDATISNAGCYVRLAKDSGGTNLYSKGVTSCNFTTLKNEKIIDVPSVDTNDDPIDFWNMLQIRIANGTAITGTLTIKPQLFDLTLMGIDNLTLDEVKQWFADYFPLPYYQYDSGSLLPFRGEGLKTVGKNLLMPTATFPQTINGVTFTLNSDSSVTANGTANGDVTLIYWGKNTYGGKLLADGTYVLSGIIGGSASTYTIRTNGFGGISITSGESSFTITDGLPQTNIIITISNNVTVNNVVFKPMIRRANITDNTFESYTSSTLSLPISTYYPSGMKSAGNVYDELTETKAITRIGAVDLGSLTWTYETDVSWGNSFRARTDYIKFQGQLLCTRYQGYVGALNNMPDMSISATNSQAYLFLRVKDSNYTDATAFKTAMNGIPLYFELATPTETSFTTASLVTENAEIPLSNEDGVLVGKCTEQLSENPGFIDAKIKLSDSDGECYSNKIQLHVERSPQ